jgi:hypothetical protein
MMEWILADSGMPNYVAMLLLACAALGLYATTYATNQLQKATRKWEEVLGVYREIIELEDNDGQ